MTDTPAETQVAGPPVPYRHVIAPGPLLVDGVLAFTKGDPVPLETAERLGLLDGSEALEVRPGHSESPEAAGFVDEEITVRSDPPVDENPADQPSAAQQSTARRGAATRTDPPKKEE